jgi:hypothetical protein
MAEGDVIQKCPKCKGVVHFVIQGVPLKLQSDGDVTILASRQRRTETYDGEFTMEERNPKITCTLVVPMNVKVSQIQDLCDVPVVVELCDGRAFSTDHASNVSDNPYDAKKNLQPIELICDRISEMLPQATGIATSIGGGVV